MLRRAIVDQWLASVGDTDSPAAWPESEKPQPALKLPTVTTVRQFREELLLLDKTIMRFVTNPVFQASNSVDVNLAKNASEDLEQ